MSPRPYRLGQRQAAIDETRARVIAAARTLLEAAEPGRFSVDAVAQHADVSRATVYYQFHSKLGLLEALFDSVGAAGGMAGLADAFRLPDPLLALDEFVAVFGRFWSADRTLHRRLRGLAALDPDLSTALAVRQEWRRRGATALVTRLTARPGDPPSPPGPGEAPPPQGPAADAVDLLFAVTSFETFDVLAGPDRTPEAVIPLAQHLARAAVSRLIRP